MRSQSSLEAQALASLCASHGRPHRRGWTHPRRWNGIGWIMR